jgi:hypothetical protein
MREWRELISGENGNMREVNCEKLMTNRQEHIEPTGYLAEIEGLTFPYDQDSPTERSQLTLFDFVSPDILLELVPPKSAARLGVRCLRAVAVPVPETSMDEHGLPEFWKDQVRRSRKVATVKAKAIT